MSHFVFVRTLERQLRRVDLRECEPYGLADTRDAHVHMKTGPLAEYLWTRYRDWSADLTDSKFRMLAYPIPLEAHRAPDGFTFCGDIHAGSRPADG